MQRAERKQNIPFVSVVMPVRNEADFIERSLRAVFTQTYPHDSMEIIVADGRSTDATLPLIESLKSSTDISISIVENSGRIAPTGLNRAIAAARGDILIRVDGHCEIDSNYVANCVKYLQSGKAEAVGGPIETIGETLTAQAIAAAMSSNFGVGGSAFRCGGKRETYVDTVAFPGYRREVFEKIGLFNEELVRNQDDEFNYRLRKTGGRILLAPEILSKYYSRSTFKSLWRQYFQYGYWKVRVLRLHPKQMSLRQFVPFAFVAALFVLAVSSLFFTGARFAALLVLTAYAAAALVSAFQSAGRTRNRLAAVPQIFLSFLILHFSYGLGFAAGLIRFGLRRGEKGFEKTEAPALRS